MTLDKHNNKTRYAMMNLTIETANARLVAAITDANDNALNQKTLKGYMEVLRSDIPNCKVGRGAGHVWVSDLNNKRIATVTNLFNC